MVEEFLPILRTTQTLYKHVRFKGFVKGCLKKKIATTRKNYLVLMMLSWIYVARELPYRLLSSVWDTNIIWVVAREVNE